MRKEIEVKAKTNNLDAIAQKLKGLGCVVSDPVIQNDTIFVDDNYGQFDEFQPGKNILRIREAGGKYLLTLKLPQSNEQDAIEHEVEINHYAEMENMLQLMGYHQAVQVRKTRRKTTYRDWEICLDEVDGLGSFVEVEAITDDVDVIDLQNQLFDFLLSLGVRAEDRITNGYDTLIYRMQKSSNSISQYSIFEK